VLLWSPFQAYLSSRGEIVPPKVIDTGRLTYGQATADWQERLNVDRMREERAERARQVMRKYGVAVLLEASAPNIRYLTGLIGFPLPQTRYCLFFADHPTVMYEHNGWFHQMPDQAPWIKEWRPARGWLAGAPGQEASRYQSKLFAGEIAQELKDRGLLDEKIAVGGLDGMASAALAEAGVSNMTASAPLMLEARMIKTPDEIDCLKMVAAICNGIWFRVWESVRPGMSDTELGRIVASAGYEFGAEFSHTAGWRSGPMTFEQGFSNSGRLLQSGDLMFGSVCGFTYMGYSSCTIRTMSLLKKPPEKAKDWYKEVLERVDTIISEIKPGASSDMAARHFPPAAKYGYKLEEELLTAENGHGVGLGATSGYDYPIFNRQWGLKFPVEFQEGMVVAVETREGEKRVGAARLENMVVVTKDGAEIIDTFPRDEILVAPR
jgi:Xaa-Pro aminopeptidase